MTDQNCKKTIVAIAKKIKNLFYMGNALACPICTKQFRKFLPFGVIPRKDAQCPHCGSLERHRLLWLYLQSRTDLFSKSVRLLHFAPEECFQNVFKKSKTMEYISADLYAHNAMIKMDITDIKFQDNIFDVVLCNHVLEHIVDDEKAMKELYRVLKPDGFAILQVPIDTTTEITLEDFSITSPEERLHHYGQEDHVSQLSHLIYPKKQSKSATL